MTPRRRRTWLPWVATATAGTLLALILVNLFTMVELDSAATRTWNNRQIRELIDRVQVALTDAETAQRGYLLTGESEYLAPLRAAEEILGPALARGAKLTAKDPVQSQRFEALTRFAQEKMAELDRTVDQAQHGHIDDALAFLRSGFGKRTMDNARQVIADLRAEEDARLARGSARTFAAVEIATAIEVGAGIGLVGLGVVLFTIHRDIARREILEKALGEALELQERFIGVLSHDLRNPLAAISMTASLVQRQGDLSPTQSTGLVRILSSSSRMARMVDQLLDLTRARSGGGLVVHPKPEIDLAKVTSDVVDELRAANPGKEIRLETRGDTTGTWDADGLAQVVSNLVANAIQHGEPPIHVTITSNGELVTLDVHNGGKAIPEDLLPFVFEPFRSAYPAGEHGHHEGLGLGLFISQEVVIAHGGTIEVVSSDEAGTTFQVVLPRSPR